MNFNLMENFLNNLGEKKDVQNFINELSSNLEENKIEEVPILEQILSENEVSIGNENEIRDNIDNIILDMSNEKYPDKEMFFVEDSKKAVWKNNQKQINNDVYKVLKVKNNNIQEIAINKSEMPKEIGVNSVFFEENGKYVLDSLATNEINNKIKEMANDIINGQNTNLDSYRKEGHLYEVAEDINDSIFLRDLTENNGIEFEEVNFPKELINEATEGQLFKYSNGKYEKIN